MFCQKYLNVAELIWRLTLFSHSLCRQPACCMVLTVSLLGAVSLHGAHCQPACCVVLTVRLAAVWCGQPAQCSLSVWLLYGAHCQPAWCSLSACLLFGGHSLFSVDNQPACCLVLTLSLLTVDRMGAGSWSPGDTQEEPH